MRRVRSQATVLASVQCAHLGHNSGTIGSSDVRLARRILSVLETEPNAVRWGRNIQNIPTCTVKNLEGARKHRSSYTSVSPRFCCASSGVDFCQHYSGLLASAADPAAS